MNSAPSPAFLTRAQVRAFDRHAIDVLGIPSAVLMENAGRGAAQVLQALGIHGRVVIACGKGNNGGDGLVMARHLASAGCDVLILLFARTEELSPDAALQWSIVQKMGLRTQQLAGAELDLALRDEGPLADRFAGAQWLVDALFGTGLNGPVRAPCDRLIALINASPARVLAVDIPSGLNADTGEAGSATVRACHTVTFVAPKMGYGQPSAAEWLGRVHVADIGLGPAFGPATPPGNG